MSVCQHMSWWYICRNISTVIYLSWYVCRNISAVTYQPQSNCRNISAVIHLPKYICSNISGRPMSDCLIVFPDVTVWDAAIYIYNIYMHTYIYKNRDKCIYVCVYICIYVYVYVYIYSYSEVTYVLYFTQCIYCVFTTLSLFTYTHMCMCID